MGDAGPQEEILTFDQLLRIRAVDTDQTPILAYPKSKLGVSDYEFITGEALNRLIDGAVKSLLNAGFEAVYEERIIGIYSASDLDYVINVYALARLGYTPFLLSPRLPASAVATLLKGSKSTTLVHGLANSNFAASVKELSPEIRTLPLIIRDQYESTEHTKAAQFARIGLDNQKEHFRTYLMLHSSGSTGLPKPIRFSNKRLTVMFLTAQHRRTWLSVPFSHAFGMVCYTQAVYSKTTMYVMNGHVPQTHDTVTASIVAAKPEVVWTVPYVLKLLAERQDGIDALKSAYLVSSSGSRLPDELGDLLVNQGVFVGLTFGATETASLFSSLLRPRDDKAWNYMSLQPHVKAHVLMRPVDDGEMCEAIVLASHRSLAIVNSNDPPGSYHTSDLFVEHGTLKGRWKFVGRRDDRITLLNGEKCLPLPIEGRIRAFGLVREAVLFGVDRPVPGLLLFKASNATHLSDEEYLDVLWPVIEDANTHAEGFSQISRDMVIIVGADVDCPTTDKSSIKRAQIYQDFAKKIDEVYIRLENHTEGEGKKLSIPELQEWILWRFQDLNVELADFEQDFFTSGIDSLKAIQMRGLIIKELDLGGNRCPSMVVYDCGNTAKLAQKLYELRTAGIHEEKGDGQEIEAMKELIQKYSKFEIPERTNLQAPSTGSVVILTGATGSLGVHVLSQILSDPKISKIYCFIRASRLETLSSRLLSTMKAHNLSLHLSKVTALSTSFGSPNFGLSPFDYANLQAQATHIIHCAWSVNFALPVKSFEDQIYGLHQLLELSMTAKHSCKLSFCSSVGAAMGGPPRSVKEDKIEELSYASPTGYSRSKLVAERIIEVAAKEYGATATVFRIGQIIPSRNEGSRLWNVDEMIPLIVRSALAVGVLPDRANGSGMDRCAWFEVDGVARAILQLSGISSNEEGADEGESGLKFYNVVKSASFSWSQEFLPILMRAGLNFEVVSWQEWLAKLREVEDMDKNPSRKLLSFWEEQGKNGGETSWGSFETQEGERRSAAMRNRETVVDGNLVEDLLSAWREVW